MSTAGIHQPERPICEFGSRYIEVPAQAHTYAGFLDWVMSDTFPEKVRVCFSRGQVGIDMSEESVDTHAEVKIGIYRTLLPLTADDDFGRIYADGMLFCNEACEVSANPDGIGMRWSTIESGRASFIVRGGIRRAVQGTPDWILEILSTSSVKKDLVTHREDYHRAGIPEYWLVDARGEELIFQILCWTQDGYEEAPTRGGWVESKVFGHRFRLTRTQDRLGLWLFTLESKRVGRSKKR